jgi:hypothetical protein
MKTTIAVIGLVVLLGLLVVSAAAYCTNPVVPNTQSGQIYVACNFPYPWSLLFGGGSWHYYQFNLFLCLAVPAITIIAIYMQYFGRNRN